MKTRLFHTIIVCGTALGGASLASCATDAVETTDAAPMAPPVAADRCRLPDGACNEHCTPLPGGACLDPCFVHTVDCSPDCRQLDGTCGWPPTK